MGSGAESVGRLGFGFDQQQAAAVAAGALGTAFVAAGGSVDGFEQAPVLPDLALQLCPDLDLAGLEVDV